MIVMLNYMRDNNIYNVLLNVSPDVHLIGYSDFPEAVRNFMEDNYTEFKTNPVLKIKNYFGSPDQENLEESLKSEFTRSVNSLFTPDFFSVIIKHNDNTEKSELPMNDIGYSIKSQTIDLGGLSCQIFGLTPQVIGMEPGSHYHTRKILLGIDESFESKLTLPDQEEPWSITIKSEPEGKISNIIDISDG